MGSQRLFHHFDRLVSLRDDTESKQELLQVLASQLDFPSHFGHNWDALYDCLCDLSWLDAHSIVLVHEQVPLQDREEERNQYLAALADAVEFWQKNGERELLVILPNG